MMRKQGLLRVRTFHLLAPALLCSIAFSGPAGQDAPENPFAEPAAGMFYARGGELRAYRGQPFHEKLSTQIAEGEWSGSSLPAGLQVMPDGTITGIPRLAGVFQAAFACRQNGRVVSLSRHVFRVLASEWEEPGDLPMFRNGPVMRVHAGSPVDAGFGLVSDRIYRLDAVGPLPAGTSWLPVPGLLTGRLQDEGVFTIPMRVNGSPDASIEVVLQTQQMPTGVPELEVNGNRVTGPFLSRVGAAAGEPLSYVLEAWGGVNRWRAWNLPVGITLDEDAGVVSGSATEPGVYDVVVAAENAQGTSEVKVLRILIYGPATRETDLSLEDFRNFALDGNPPNEIVGRELSSPLIRVGIEGAEGVPLVFFAEDLPEGIVLDETEGLLQGEVAEAGEHRVRITARGVSIEATREVRLIFLPLNPVHLQAHGGTADLGGPVEIFVEAQGAEPSRYEALGLPEGLTFDEMTGSAQGRILSPDSLGAFSIVGFDAANRPMGFGSAGLGLNPEFHPYRTPPSRGRGSVLYFPPGIESASIPTDWLEAGEDAWFEVNGLPEGFRFSPPATLFRDLDVPAGLYSAELTAINELGFGRGRLIVVVEPEERRPEFVGDFNDMPFSVGEPFSRLLHVGESVRLTQAVLPAGIRISDDGRRVEGIPEEAGVFLSGVWAEGEEAGAASYDVALMEIAPREEPLPPAVAYRDWPLDWIMERAGQMSFGEASGLPPGLRYAGSGSQHSIEGRAEMTGTYHPAVGLNGLSLRMPELTVYERPGWSPFFQRVRRLPGLNLFVLPQNVLISYGFKSGEETVPAMYWFSASLHDWTMEAFPGYGPADMALFNNKYFAWNGPWFATGMRLHSEFLPFVPAATRGNSPMNAGVSNGAAMAGVGAAGGFGFANAQGIIGLSSLSSSPALLDVAEGNGLFVGVGERGSVMTPFGAGWEGRWVSPVESGYNAPVQLILQSVIHTGDRWFAAGNYGTILSSANGEDWEVERGPDPFGAAFFRVTADADWVVATGPVQTWVRPRAGSAADWRMARLRPREGGVLADLEIEGTLLEGTEIILPAPPVSSVVLFEDPFPSLMVGVPVNWALPALGDAKAWSARGLPEGLQLATGTGQLTGACPRSGSWNSVLEVVGEDRTFGQVVQFRVYDGLSSAGLLEPLTVPYGYGDPIVLPLSNFPHRVEVIDSRFPGQVSYRDGAVTVLFSDYRREDGGETLYWFDLRIENAMGVNTERVKIRSVPPRPVFVGELLLVETEDGGKIHATVQGAWPMQFEWIRDGTVVENGAEVSGADTETLVFRGTVPGGVYRLKATNALGSSESPAITVEASLSYAAWAAASGLSLNPQIDGNENGYADLWDYALAADAPSDLMKRLPRVARSAEGIVFEYRKSQGIGNVLYEIYGSADLQSWNRLEPAMEESSEAGGSIAVRVPLVSSDREMYYRLRVALDD